eukprot:TRINITY_DN26976_c0_g1_i1.p1 TRINITY_DN26976_c0_g1~~TRINITY_DN26976_c0_g1_i1.p1  ORF type:complete len:257 (+),score=62.24 TRINITY_DN26976_c0_g1_i1:62-832(+)
MASPPFITITFGNQAENHKGMEVLGFEMEHGLSNKTLKSLQAELLSNGHQAELIEIEHPLGADHDGASVLVIRNGVESLFTQDPVAMFEEVKAVDWDAKAYMYGRVVTKRARWNLCFGDSAQDPNYEDKKGRVVAFSTLPCLQATRSCLSTHFGPFPQPLLAEGNYYYDGKKTGIGFHGDSERKVVIAMRLQGKPGAMPPLLYQWFLRNKAVSERIAIPLSSGDVYVMSDKAVGYDWKKSSIHTLRHATGAAKYVK